MFWTGLIVAALAAHVSCQNLQYTGTILLTRDDFCNFNNIRAWRCDDVFSSYLTANPQLEKCTPNGKIYSNRCSALPDERPVSFPVETRFNEPATTPERRPANDADLEVPQPSVPYDRKVMDFSLKLFQKAFPSDNSKNYIISPLMVQTLLSYLTEGASNVTRQEMETVLRLNTVDLADIARALGPAEYGDTPKYKLDIASQIYKSTNFELLPGFRESLKRNQAPLEEMDFSNKRKAVETINDWVKQQTREKILEVVDEKTMDPETQLLLLNAIYFNGTWMYKFNNKTDRGFFYHSDQQTERMPVNMMHLTQELRNGNTKPDSYARGMAWLELPYNGDRMSMILFLPNERFQLERELRKLTVQDLDNILAEIERDETSKVRVQLPEFKAESTVSLVEPLKSMGVASMFGDKKPFDRMSNENVKVSDVKQKSFLTVNRHGTVATTVTVATVIPLSITHTMEFKADQPFALMIVDKHKKLPLFFAKISQPLKVTAKNG
ncbi:leukocyte elastase inhibitor-like [Anopheles nili]|uniref:leukocyte elastase inhibitor-like n=1 Tax=Anopheles nili TaxID=185578 RepID=UPI00237A670F|nr:leukocyte elastase inhibitor-like [Anopheles nili]